MKHPKPSHTSADPCRRFCVAPMMDWTDRHDRYFLRQISRRARLYTEMVTTGALLHGDAGRFLRFHPDEHPVALQLGGCEPDALARCSEMAQAQGYDEVNLNVGCPSDRVQAARFGACLMREPALVAGCITAMREACDIDVTVKCRIGVDDMDSYEHFIRFIETVANTGNTVFIVHARKAWLKGLSPRQNREIPPLHYDYVYLLKQACPELEIIINGGIESLDDVDEHLKHVDGVMLGRAAYKNPYLLAEVDQRYFGCDLPVPGRQQIVESMLPYIIREMAEGVQFKHISRHMLGLFQGQYGGRLWRRILSEEGCKPGAGPETLHKALAAIEPAADARAA